jgi:thiol-disulfide isomerase/thioredoxin
MGPVKHHIDRRLTIALVAVIVALLVVPQHPAESQGGPLAKPVRAPAFSTTTLDHKRISLRSLRGKVVLVDFWATWCGPCRMSVPDLTSLRRQFSSQPFTVVGMSMDDTDTINAVRPFAKQYRMNYPVGVSIADNKNAALAYGVESLPAMILIDKKGFARYAFSGYSYELKPLLAKWIKQLAAEKG